ncbi:sensor histidine kinase, partial [Vibrio alfacsensis]
LKQNIETVTLKEELAHVNAYLTIEKARFTDRLEVDIDIAPELLEQEVPSFTLQPLVENAIKHGISNLIKGGIIRIYSHTTQSGSEIVVEDNAGTFIAPNEGHEGLGMQIVGKRLTNQFGRDGALKIEVEKD